MHRASRLRSGARRTGLAVVATVLLGCGGEGDRSAMQEAVAERGAQVMPFDLETTTHVFAETDDGGVQSVVADDPGDAAQIELIRSHLREEQASFADGDFGDPAAIHGHDMPGVAELEAGFRDITVTYDDLPDGARLIYSTRRPELVAAVHAWFDRQLMDHGDHAEGG